MYAVPLDANEANSSGDQFWTLFCDPGHGIDSGNDGRLVSDGTVAKVCNCCPASRPLQWLLTTPSAERQELDIPLDFCWV